MDFKYKVSVIVPVYNVEEYLAMCLDSLVNQTIDKNLMEILVINDGSTDNSLDICREYEKKYPCIKVFSKENEGLSATRNYGIQRAQGKYLMYIDSDDYFSPDTVQGVTEFFDTVYDSVDLVTYFEQPYATGCVLPPHFRFKYYLKKSGIYDLEKYPFILQMRVNVCVKNLGEKNFLFDTTPNFRQEDQEYNNRVLMDKMKIGFSDVGCYYYNKSNENSIVATSFNTANLFEYSMDYLERLFSYYDGEIPRYFQAVCFHDFRWKYDRKILMPYHYEGKQFQKAIGRIKALLARIDNEVITGYPNLSDNMKAFWLSFKDNANVIPYTRSRKIMLLSEGKCIYKKTKMKFQISSFRPTDRGTVLCRGYIETPLYNFVKEEPEIFALENGNNEVRLKTYLSKYGYLNGNDQILNYYAFEYEIDAERVESFRLYVKRDGFELVTNYAFFIKAGISTKRRFYDCVFGNTLICLRNNTFLVSAIDNEARDRLEIAHTYGYYADESIMQLRLEAIEYRKHHRVWLYSDLYTVEKDNGYYQFIHDFNKNDGVERYYVYTRELESVAHLFSEEMKEYLVEFGSEKHRLLYLSSELVLSGFYGRTPISPFEKEWEEAYYYDMEHFRIIYLQHGVLHASLYYQNSAENARADKVVISSPFEMDNLTGKYHYHAEDLIPSAMARYDHIERSNPPKGRILFAPSWRNYFARNVTASRWETDLEGIKKSDYYKNIYAFLQDERLAAALEKANVVLEVKLHPIIADAADSLFSFPSNNIVLAARNVDVTDYDMFITDFSSFIFDYACLSRPIMYFVPDYLQFKSGMGHYRDLDLPFDKAFGYFTTAPEKAAAYTVEKIESGFALEPEYKQRMDTFYYPLDNCCERLYDYITKHMLLGEVNSDVQATD